ncbi:MAG: hypothetical protein WD645_06160, partial [Dehalococcoidia bacterium]
MPDKPDKQALAASAQLTAPAAPYSPTATEAAALVANSTRRANRAPLVRLKTSNYRQEGLAATTSVSVDHPDPIAGERLFREQLATDDAMFSSVLSEQLGLLALNEAGTGMDDQTLNRHLSVVRAIAPNDEIETLLACQMTAVH